MDHAVPPALLSRLSDNQKRLQRIEEVLASAAVVCNVKHPKAEAKKHQHAAEAPTAARASAISVHVALVAAGVACAFAVQSVRLLSALELHVVVANGSRASTASAELRAQLSNAVNVTAVACFVTFCAAVGALASIVVPRKQKERAPPVVSTTRDEPSQAAADTLSQWLESVRSSAATSGVRSAPATAPVPATGAAAADPDPGSAASGAAASASDASASASASAGASTPAAEVAKCCAAVDALAAADATDCRIGELLDPVIMKYSAETAAAEVWELRTSVAVCHTLTASRACAGLVRRCFPCAVVLAPVSPSIQRRQGVGGCATATRQRCARGVGAGCLAGC
jgi:hypothetical protein